MESYIDYKHRMLVFVALLNVGLVWWSWHLFNYCIYTSVFRCPWLIPHIYKTIQSFHDFKFANSLCHINPLNHLSDHSKRVQLWIDFPNQTFSKWLPNKKKLDKGKAVEILFLYQIFSLGLILLKQRKFKWLRKLF